jgi:hypothetical protein
MMRLCIVSAAASAMAIIATAATPTVTFHKDVQPILQNHCQECHRPGQVAPMSLLTYQQARPWAKSIRQAVATKKMPPWFADPHEGKFSNDRSLSQSNIDTLVAWVDAGAPEGNPKDAPAPREWAEGGWNAGKPDLVVEAPVPFQVPAKGEIPYQWVIVPTNLKEDKWVVSAEVMPGDRSVIHHIVLSIREPGNPWMADKKPGEYFGGTLAIERGGKLAGSPETMGGYFAQYEPGSIVPPANPHVATLLKAGSDIVFQIHYTPNGKATTDQTKVGFIFSDRPPDMKFVNVTAINPTFVIPPGADNYKIEASATVNFDGELVSIYPHAHLRGKAYEFRAVYPTGEEETLLKCAYNFNWQLTYILDKPKPMPKGTKIFVTAWYDNSANNPFNPDPTKAVRWGEQSWEEMMISTAVFKVPNKPTERASQ